MGIKRLKKLTGKDYYRIKKSLDSEGYRDRSYGRENNVTGWKRGKKGVKVIGGC